MNTKTVKYIFMVLASLGLLSGMIASPAWGNPPLQGSATEQPAATGAPAATAVSVDDLSVISVDPLDMVAGPAGTRALISPDGKRFAYASAGKKTICLYTVAGQQENCIDVSKVPLTLDSLRWSPDSRKLALTENFLQYFLDPDIWIVDATTGQLTDVTDDGVVGSSMFKDMNANIDLSPYWSSDSTRLAFIRYIQTGKEISASTFFTIAAAGGTPERMGELQSPNRFSTYLLAWSPDGSEIAYNVDTAKKGTPENGVWLADLNGQNQKQILKAPQDLPGVIEFSPDGRYVLSIAHWATLPAEPAQSPVRVAPVDGSGDILVDQDHLVLSAAWAPSGAGLAYVVFDDAHPDTSGLYLTAEPGKPGRLVLPGMFMAPSPGADQLSWSADNTILLSTRGGKPLNVVHLGYK
jgi:dipeptidyl aminopeptidase/acylaminoacyl peptidase